ncbi:hypothetical protein R3P38DRAFT_2827642 [Favolaschia claudopus]|uniref:Uncharacterized protein n=1 Tax=Favolaschia claudopus TaxID=2862362 RepID=A0AAW0EJ97_9AGAR
MAMFQNMRLEYDNMLNAGMEQFKSSAADHFHAIERQRDMAREENAAMRAEGERLTALLAAREAELQKLQFDERTQDPRTQDPRRHKAPSPSATPRTKASSTKTAGSSSPNPPSSSSPKPSSSARASRGSPKAHASTAPPRSSPDASASPSDLPSGSTGSSKAKAGASQGATKGNNNQDSAKKKGKQQTEDDDDTTKKGKGKGSPRKLGQHQMLKGDIDRAADGVKAAFQTHIRFIGNCLVSGKAPPSASPALVKRFELRLQGSTTTELVRSGVYKMPVISPSAVKLGVDVREAIRGNSKILKAYAKMEEADLLSVKAYIAGLGINVWAIDYTQSPNSVYNSAMRKCAIHTFRFLCASKAYDFFTMDTSFINDVLLLTRLYDHFVHHHLNMQWQAEVRNPGASEANIERNRLIQTRSRLYASRSKKMDEFKIHSRIKAMFAIKATSDDEGDAKNARARVQPERSAAANGLVDALEDLICKDLVDDGKRDIARRRRNRRSVPLEGRNDSQFEEIPKEMPIQYYDPSWFNSKPVQTRAKLNPKLVVSFVPGTTNYFSSVGNNGLSGPQLTAKYGRMVFADYDLNFDEAEGNADVEDADGNAEDEEGEGDSIGSQDSEEEAEMDDAASIGSFLDDDDAEGSTDEEDDDQEYEQRDDDEDMEEIFGNDSDKNT